MKFLVFGVKREALALILMLPVLGGCRLQSDNASTLYRNSPLGLSDRVHFATFDADESAEYNGGNCKMTARLLNANVAASARAEGKMPIRGAGFWCELGHYAEDGQVPKAFQTAFPATSDSPLSW